MWWFLKTLSIACVAFLLKSIYLQSISMSKSHPILNSFNCFSFMPVCILRGSDHNSSEQLKEVAPRFTSSNISPGYSKESGLFPNPSKYLGQISLFFENSKIAF